jgi:adenosylcobinamide-GDP ribazoletransferase
VPEPGRWNLGLRLAITTLTAVPVGRRTAPVDRAAAGVAMALAPAIGAALGVVLAVVGLGAVACGGPYLVAAVLTIGAGALLTRGLHLDGLADTADGLGSYAGPEQALAIMRRSDIGPFGVVAIVLVLLAQVAAVAAVLTNVWYTATAAIVTASATGRLAISLACRRGVPAARDEGLGALVAGTVGRPVLAIGAVAIAAVGTLAVPGRPWQGPVAVAISLALAAGLVRHAVRRLGGVTGDVLGAVCELASTLTYVVVSI